MRLHQPFVPLRCLTALLAVVLVIGRGLATPLAQSTASPVAPVPASSATGSTSASVPSGYVIGAGDILSIVFWRDKDMSAEVMVRPDGKISLPLLNDIDAAGSTPEELRERLTQAAGKYIDDPNATVVVKDIRSRNVFITGFVAKPSTYPLVSPMNVLQLIALAGGLLDYANSKQIVVVRNENGKTTYHKFNYNDVVRQKHIEQNIALRPGDTVVVP